jgi:hypothetical protein
MGYGVSELQRATKGGEMMVSGKWKTAKENHEAEKGEDNRLDGPMPAEMDARFGWQDDEIIVLYDDDGNRITEEEWRAKLKAKKEAQGNSQNKKRTAKNPYSKT